MYVITYGKFIVIVEPWAFDMCFLKKGEDKFFMIPWREKFIWGEPFLEMGFNLVGHRGGMGMSTPD